MRQKEEKKRSEQQDAIARGLIILQKQLEQFLNHPMLPVGCTNGGSCEATSNGDLEQGIECGRVYEHTRGREGADADCAILARTKRQHFNSIFSLIDCMFRFICFGHLRRYMDYA